MASFPFHALLRQRVWCKCLGIQSILASFRVHGLAELRGGRSWRCCSGPSCSSAQISTSCQLHLIAGCFAPFAGDCSRLSTDVNGSYISVTTVWRVVKSKLIDWTSLSLSLSLISLHKGLSAVGFESAYRFIGLAILCISCVLCPKGGISTVQSHREEYPTRSRRERGWNRGGGICVGCFVCFTE